jgi:SAM-dependent methyltransferase
MKGRGTMFHSIGRTLGNLCTSCFKPQSAEDVDIRLKKVIKNTADASGPTPGLAYFLEKFSSALAKGRTLVAIDLGAGGGRDTRTLAALGWHVTAVDTNDEVKNALIDFSDNPAVQIHHGTLQQAGIQDASVDLVNAQRVLPYIHDKDLENTLMEAARTLRPGGHLCISFFGHKHSWNDGTHPDLTFQTEKGMEEILGLLRKAGFPNAVVKPSITSIKAAKDGKKIKSWHEITVIAEKKEAVKQAGGGVMEAKLRAQLPEAGRSSESRAGRGDSMEIRRISSDEGAGGRG